MIKRVLCCIFLTTIFQLQSSIVITTSGTYHITYDTSYTPTIPNDSIFKISASNVTLDFGNHIITQDSNAMYPGLDAILVGTGCNNVAIKNVNIQNVSGVGIHVYDACSGISVWDSRIQSCNAGGIFLEGSPNGYGITGATVANTYVNTCTGVDGNPAYGIRMTHGLLGKVKDCYVAFSDAGTTAQAYGIMFDHWCAFQVEKTTIASNGGTGMVAGLASTQSFTGLVEEAIFYKNINRDLTATGTVCGMLLDRSSDILVTTCKSSANLNNQMASIGFLAQGGGQNVFKNCLSELNTGGQYAAGFKLDAEHKSSIINCLIQDQKTITSGIAHGIVLANDCDKCQIVNNQIFNTMGIDASFGIKDERVPSTSAVIKNYAFNNDINYSVTYATDVTLPVISANLSQTPGIPSGVGGILDNIDITP